MGQPLGGAGILLPPPQNYYPSELRNAPQDPSSNVMTLAGGDTFVIPAGLYYLDVAGPICLQFQDPVNGIWELPRTGSDGFEAVKSDGYNVRLANLSGCFVGAVITNAGSGYTQATAACAASAGGSTWQPVVGGQLSLNSITAKGGNYGVAPLVMIPPPPSPGVQATAYTVITSGTVSGVTLDNVGAGYIATPLAVIVPSPFDPNLSTGVTTATMLLGVVGAGSISAILCTNPGAPVATSGVSLTISGGAGINGAATAVQMATLTSVAGLGTGTAGGAGFTSGGGLVTTVGGVPTATPVITNPLIEGRLFQPRPAQMLLQGSGGSVSSVSTVYDGGLFMGVPLISVANANGGLLTTGASVTATLGTTIGTVRITPAP
jgi:hypothetical protein